MTPPTPIELRKVADKGKFPGEHPNIYTGYTIRGHAAAPWPPVIGEHLVVLRTERNGIKSPGIFETSRVETVQRVGETNEWYVSTVNSTYLATILDSEP